MRFEIIIKIDDKIYETKTFEWPAELIYSFMDEIHKDFDIFIHHIKFMKGN